MNMISRKEFIGASGAFAAMPLSAADEKPLWKAGIVTDTHVKRTRESCALVQAACDLFARHNIDVFANCGDIADYYYEEAYPILDEITRGAFPDKKPVRLWVYANHDRLHREKESWKSVFADVKRLLNATNDIYDCIDFKGMPLVTLPQFWVGEKEVAYKLLADVAARYPTGPIFVFDHVPPVDTVDGSITWGGYAAHQLYSKYPRVIHICGHAHSSLRSELNIWQGAFTAVSAGCLAGWGGHAVARPPEGKSSYGALIMEVYRSKIVFRRFDVRTGREYAAASPWTLPLPFKAESAPYRRAERASAARVPSFPADARLTVSADNPFTAVTLGIPSVRTEEGVYRHRVQVFDAKGGQIVMCDVFGQFHLPVDERAPVLERTLNASLFDPGVNYRVRVTPCNCFGKGGKPIEASFTAPGRNPSATVIFETDDPVRDCRFLRGLEGGSPLSAEDGWFSVASGNNRLEFPAHVWDGIERGTRLRFMAEVETDQTSCKTWTMVLRHPNPLKNATGRVATPNGRSGRMRYAFDFVNRHKRPAYYLLVREGGNGRIRFSRIRIERLDPEKKDA